MSQIDAQAREIFLAALDLESAEQIQAYVDEVCGEDEQLRNRVHVLLSAKREAGNFLEGGRESLTASFDADTGTRIGQRIGPYKLLQEIGEGGMGTVYMAQQEQPVRRRVALKVIKAGMDSKQVIGRFEAERQAVSMMDHPNIAHVLEVGTTDAGQPYFVMELVKGLPITRYCDEKRLVLRERLELFKAICHAVQHAHQKGIIHRDIKPSNILVAEYDNLAVPKIIDFGLAKALNQQLTDKTMFTHFGQVVGTFEYMSPEQSKMNQLDVDTRTDIYSLGVLLYELVTGTPPFDKQRFSSAGLEQVMKIIREEDPPRPSTRLRTIESHPNAKTGRTVEQRRLSGLVKGDLDWIVMKAMDKERSRRYETVNGLAFDIQRHLDGEPIVAAPPSTRYRVKKFVQRNRTAVAFALLVPTLLMVGIIGTSTGLVWALKEKNRADLAANKAFSSAEAEREAREQALEAREQALEEKASAEYLQAASILNAAVSYLGNSSIAPAQRSLQVIPPQYRNWEWAYLANKAWRPYSPARAAFTNMADLRTSADIWEAGAVKIVRVIVSPGIEGGISDGDFDADGDEVFVTTANGSIGRYSLTTNDPPKFFRAVDDNLWFVSPSPDGRKLLGAALSGSAYIWDVDTMDPPVKSEGNDLFTSGGYFWSPDQKFVVSFHNDQTMRQWNAESLEYEGSVTNLTNDQFSDLFFSPSGNFVLSASLDGAILKWNFPFDTSAEELINFAPQTGGLNLQLFAPDGTTVVAHFDNGSSFLWDIYSGEILQKLTPRTTKLQPRRIKSAEFSPDGSCVAVVSDGDNAIVFRVADGKPIAQLTGHAARILSMNFSADGTKILTVSGDGTAIIWSPDFASSDKTRRFNDAHDDIIFQIDFDSTGKKLLTGSYDETARVWNLATQGLICTYEGHESEIVAVDFNSNGTKAATLDAKGNLHIWDAGTGEALIRINPESDEFAKQISRAAAGVRRQVLGFPGPLSTGIFSPDDSCVVLFHQDSMKVFDAKTGTIKTTLQGATACGWPVFSHDSKLVSILEMNARDAGVWELESGKMVTRLNGKHNPLIMLQFSPNDDRIITGDMLGRTIIWNSRDGEQPLKVLKREASIIRTCRYSPDGRFIMSVDGTSSVIWDAESGEMLTVLQGHTTEIKDIRVSPDKTRFITWATNDKVIVWDFKKPKANPLMSIKGDAMLLQVRWTPDGKDVITAWSNGKIEVWSGATVQDLQSFTETADNFEFEFDKWRRKSMNKIAN